MYENAEKERSWGEKISSWNPLYDDESEEKILLKNIKQIRTQKNRGRPFGLTVVLNPKLEEHYCSVFNEQGFVVIHIGIDVCYILVNLPKCGS